MTTWAEKMKRDAAHVKRVAHSSIQVFVQDPEPEHCYGYSGCNNDDPSTCECRCAKCEAARAV